MEPLISLVNKAIAAFKRHDHAQVVLLLDQAFEYVEAMDYTAMDAKIFNALYDACEMLVLLCRLPVFEKVPFHESTLEQFKKALDRFTSKEGGTLAQLQAVMPDFLLLLRGMAVGVEYLQFRKMKMEVFPPEISFEVTAEGRILLFAWGDEQELRSADIKALRAEFNTLFEQEALELDTLLVQIESLKNQNNYPQAIALVDKAMSQHEGFKMEGYLIKGDLLFAHQQFAEAVDAYMKARVLGCPKFKFQENGKKACQLLLQNTENQQERMEWIKLLQNFF